MTSLRLLTPTPHPGPSQGQMHTGAESPGFSGFMSFTKGVM